jgi:WD40 repeat protein
LRPKLLLKGHDKPGKALEWNIFNPNLILSGSKDSRLLIWDLNLVSDSSGLIHPIKKYTTAGEICGVSWNSQNTNIFSTCGDKGLIEM